MRNLRGRRIQRTAIRAQPFRKLRQNPRNLHHLFFGKLHQPVVQVNRFQRLDEHRLPRRARAVHHARYAAPVRRPHRNHKTIVAQSDVIFAARRAPVSPRARKMLSSERRIVARPCAMPVRMRRSCGEASSLISPFGKIARRIAVARCRKSAERRGARLPAADISRHQL